MLKLSFLLSLTAWLCGFCFFIALPNLIVSATIPQMPFGGRELADWQLGIPQDSDAADGAIAVRAGASRVGRVGYRSLDAQAPWGLPLHGPVWHWSEESEMPLLGCRFGDPNYPTHVGADFPLNSGQTVYATMSGQVAWVGDNGPWGMLVVVENENYQTWFAHLSQIDVVEGQLVEAGDGIGLSGNTGNSSGPHLHYGIKYFQDESDTTGVWLNPEQFFSLDEVALIGCGG